MIPCRIRARAGRGAHAEMGTPSPTSTHQTCSRCRVPRYLQNRSDAACRLGFPPMGRDLCIQRMLSAPITNGSPTASFPKPPQHGLALPTSPDHLGTSLPISPNPQQIDKQGERGWERGCVTTWGSPYQPRNVSGSPVNQLCPASRDRHQQPAPTRQPCA